jgi:hypothetical protein
MPSADQRPVVYIPEEVGNKYRFVVVAGKRCEDLQKGAYPKVEVVVPKNRLGQAQDAPKLASFWAQVAVKEVEESRIAFEEQKLEDQDYAAETQEVPISVE